jgi:hypothetical protein
MAAIKLAFVFLIFIGCAQSYGLQSKSEVFDFVRKNHKDLEQLAISLNIKSDSGVRIVYKSLSDVVVTRYGKFYYGFRLGTQYGFFRSLVRHEATWSVEKKFPASSNRILDFWSYDVYYR